MPLAAPPAASADVAPAPVLGYRALKLWQRALDLAVDAHRLAGAFPEADQPALARDFRRAAAAVPTAVAASAVATAGFEQQRALQVTAAALARAETLAALAERTGALGAGDATAFLFTSGDVGRLLRGFTRAVAARMAPGRAEVAEDATERAPAVARVAEGGGEGEAPPVPAVVPAVVTAPPTSDAGSDPPSMRAVGRAGRGGRRSAAASDAGRGRIA